MSSTGNFKKKLLIGIYYHPEAYPPTLNAVNELAKVYDEIHILYRPNLDDCWVYPTNVTIYPSGKGMTVNQQADLSAFKKVLLFIRFSFSFFKLTLKHKPSTILVYDNFPLLSYHLFRKLLFTRHQIWYHNHDIADSSYKYSIAWFAGKAEKKAFNYLNIFSLPAAERKEYFNLTLFKGVFFCIPNYPSKKVYDKYYVEKEINESAVLIYQGRISESHGLEMMTSFLNETVCGVNLTLHLKGIASDEFRDEILRIAHTNKTADKVKFLGMTAYADVPIEGNKAHIGIGIYSKNDIMNETIGTASNKLYEYAAMGLPVLFYDNEHFNKHLSGYKWAVKCKLDKETLLSAIEFIISNYKELGRSARDDFNNMLNFEESFAGVIRYLSEK